MPPITYGGHNNEDVHTETSPHRFASHPVWTAF